MSEIKRPPNTWIIFRTRRSAEIRAQCEASGRVIDAKTISQIVAEEFRRLTPEAKAELQKERLFLAEQHRNKYPGWSYAPHMKRKEREEKRKEKEARLRASLDGIDPFAIDDTQYKADNRSRKGKAKQTPQDDLELERSRAQDFASKMGPFSQGTDFDALFPSTGALVDDSTYNPFLNTIPALSAQLLRYLTPDIPEGSAPLIPQSQASASSSVLPDPPARGWSSFYNADLFSPTDAQASNQSDSSNVHASIGFPGSGYGGDTFPLTSPVAQRSPSTHFDYSSGALPARSPTSNYSLTPSPLPFAHQMQVASPGVHSSQVPNDYSSQWRPISAASSSHSLSPASDGTSGSSASALHYDPSASQVSQNDRMSSGYERTQTTTGMEHLATPEGLAPDAFQNTYDPSFDLNGMLHGQTLANTQISMSDLDALQTYDQGAEQWRRNVNSQSNENDAGEIPNLDVPGQFNNTYPEGDSERFDHSNKFQVSMGNLNVLQNENSTGQPIDNDPGRWGTLGRFGSGSLSSDNFGPGGFDGDLSQIPGSSSQTLDEILSQFSVPNTDNYGLPDFFGQDHLSTQSENPETQYFLPPSADLDD